jgi:serine/threonine protein kinase
MTGRRLFHYEILEKLGEGGMGVVYKARDTRLDRLVALKLLPADRVSDVERKRRFFQEARAASALNHPNIVTIYDIEDDGVDSCIVMEYVPGRTLHQAIARRGLPPAEAMRCAIQIADALGRAHAAGIIHRDLKPGNVMITEDGKAKVLDFGLAKLTERGSDGPLAVTETLDAHTAEGAILGTVAYMSPEQAEGRKIDSRSDIFSLGAVLYEMVSGRKAFEGGSPLSTLAAILNKEPQPLNQVVGAVPRDLEKVIARCLRKDPARRFQLIDDVRIALEDVAQEPAENAPRLAPRRGALTAGIAAAAAAAGLLLGYLLTPARGPDPSSYRFVPVATGIEVETQPAWSQDGKALAYIASIDGVSQVFVRNLNSPTSAQITTSPSSCANPFWSPDGTHIYYHAEGHLWSVGVAGGAANRVMERVVAGSVSPNGKALAFLRGTQGNMGLWITADGNTQPQKYRAAPFPETFVAGAAPQFAPDGSKILVLISRGAGIQSREFWVLPYPSGTPRRVLPSLNPGAAIERVVWMPDSRHIVFGANMPRSSGTHLYMGDLENTTIRQITSSTSEENFPSVSPDGTQIAFVSGSLEFDLVEVPLNGDPVLPLLATARSEEFPAWAPSGAQYAYSTNAGGTIELWLRSVQEGWSRPLVTVNSQETSDWYRLERPVFSPDGQRIAYDVYGSQHAIWISPIAGGRPVRLDSETEDQHGPSWSPDGSWIAYRRQRAGKWELVKVPFGGGAPVVLAPDAGTGGGENPWSRSGRWVCFRSEKGNLHVVSSDGKEIRQLTTYRPAAYGFSKDGSLLYAVRQLSGRKWVVTLIEVPGGKEQKQLDLGIPGTASVNGFSLHPDGTRFAMAVGVQKSDIWLLEGVETSARFAWGWPRD